MVCAGPGLADVLSGRVVGVSDGDTIKVLDAGKVQHIIRVTGIDAPEKAQPFGQRSKEHLSDLVFGKNVEVQWSKLDRYQRIVGKVMVAPASCTSFACEKTLDAGLDQVRVGMAWWYRQYAKEQSDQDKGLYMQAEERAQTGRQGL